jgi:SOS response associated peptidase (SRAP)
MKRFHLRCVVQLWLTAFLLVSFPLDARTQDTEGKAKLPHLYELDDGRPFAIAGLWEWWGGPDGKSPVESCSIITTEANELSTALGSMHEGSHSLRRPCLFCPSVSAMKGGRAFLLADRFRSRYAVAHSGDVQRFGILGELNAKCRNLSPVEGCPACRKPLFGGGRRHLHSARANSLCVRKGDLRERSRDALHMHEVRC